MPRRARIDLPGYYHVINRGVNRQIIFPSDEDKTEFLKILDQSRETYHLTIHSFCILDNHYHLLLETIRNNLSLAIRYVNSQYAIYFNKKFQRIGPLWQGRFKSRYIQDENYLWLLIRYIEMNPVRAGLAERMGEYRFSSSWDVSYGVSSALLSASLLYQKDIREWLNPMRDCELAALADYEKIGQEKRENFVIHLRQNPLEQYFVGTSDRFQRNAAIRRAFRDGHGQGEIARHLDLSPVAISRIIAREQDRQKLFEKIKGKGLFWSYSKELTYDWSKAKAALLIETVLKYGDIQDLKTLRGVYGITFIKQIWEDRVKTDQRFGRLNYFLARNLFNMNVEAKDFTGVKNVRAEKLRRLAGQ